LLDPNPLSPGQVALGGDSMGGSSYLLDDLLIWVPTEALESQHNSVPEAHAVSAFSALSPSSQGGSSLPQFASRLAYWHCPANPTPCNIEIWNTDKTMRDIPPYANTYPGILVWSPEGQRMAVSQNFSESGVWGYTHSLAVLDANTEALTSLTHRAAS